MAASADLQMPLAMPEAAGLPMNGSENIADADKATAASFRRLPRFASKAHCLSTNLDMAARHLLLRG